MWSGGIEGLRYGGLRSNREKLLAETRRRLLHLQLDVDEITGQGHAKQRHEDSYEIDEESRGLEPAGLQLVPRAAVTEQPGKGQQHSPQNRDGSEPHSKSGRSECVTFQLHELADRDGETPNREAEHDDGHAGAHPREKCALVCQVITGAVGALSGCRLNIDSRWL